MQTMLTKILKRATLFSATFTLIACINLTDSQLEAKTNDASASFAPEKAYTNTVRRVLAQLQYSHYQPLSINDDFSGALLDDFVDYIDKGRQLLTSEDTQAFEAFRNRLDDDVKKGRVEVPFAIYNLVHARRLERTNYLIEQIKTLNKIDFTLDESISVDYDNLVWPANYAALKEEWRKQFKNDVLSLKLSKKDDSEISETLNKRYKNQLKRTSELSNDDVFNIFMTVFTGLYDPHTTYMAPRDSENFDINMRLSLEGIGARLQREDDYTKIVNLVPGGPAQKTGKVKPSDKILAVGQDEDGEMVDVVGWRLDDVVDLIRGPKGSTVRLQLLTSDATGTSTEAIISIVRDTIKLEDKAARKKVITLKQNGQDKKIGVIELPTFYLDFEAYHSGNKDYRSSSRDVKRLIEELNAENIDGLIVDLRNNGGGSLEEVGIITGLFTRSGPVVQVRKSSGYKDVLNDPDPSVSYDGPLAVMVNRLSASASEIFAGAIQDSGRGIVVGQRTFGKGTVQVLSEVQSAGRIKFTNASFYRISGGSTQHRGVVPDITFPSFLDEEEIGESIEKHALPWNQIKSARYYYDETVQQALPTLQKKHDARTFDDIEFTYLNDRLALIEKNRDIKTLSLNIEQREKDKANSQSELLRLVNNYRLQKKEAPFKSFSAYEEDEAEEKDEKEADALATETGMILLDYMQEKTSLRERAAAKILGKQGAKNFPVKLIQ